MKESKQKLAQQLSTFYKKLDVPSDITKIRKAVSNNLILLSDDDFIKEDVMTIFSNEKEFEDIEDRFLISAEAIMASIEDDPLEIDFNNIFFIETLYMQKHGDSNKKIIFELHSKTRIYREHGISPYESNDYDLFFALTLRQTSISDINNFLTEQSEWYDGDFKEFLENAFIDYAEYIPEKNINKSRQFLSNFDSKKEIRHERIEWKGTQKELGELFIELHNNGFIDKIKPKLIKQSFTKSNTIGQTLKPTQDQRTKENDYLGVYSAKYKPKFHAIRKNTNTK